MHFEDENNDYRVRLSEVVRGSYRVRLSKVESGQIRNLISFRGELLIQHLNSLIPKQYSINQKSLLNNQCESQTKSFPFVDQRASYCSSSH